MASRNVALRMEVYDTLDRERRPGESFSDVVARLVSERPKLSDILATIPPVSEKTSRELDQIMKRIRRDAERSIKGRIP